MESADFNGTGRWDTLDQQLTESPNNAIVLANRYRVVRKLGEGGMGTVWLAEDIKLDDRPVAIKMLPAILFNNPRGIRQLKQEAKLAMQLSHPNIVTLRAFEEEDGSAFLVMDYVEGRTLEQLLAEKETLSEDEVIRIFTPIAAALDYAHSQKVIHRDIKPSNILIRNDGTPFITDFGVAREMKDTMTRVTGKSTSGTLPYMSPEQLRGEPPAPAQDIYSLAATMYECLAGNPPFYRGQIEYQIVNEQPAELREAARLGSTIMAGLSKKARTRGAKASELISDTRIREEQEHQRAEAIRKAREEAEQERLKKLAAQTSMPPRPTSSPKKSWNGKKWLIISLLAVAGLLIWAIPGPKPAPYHSAPETQPAPAPAQRDQPAPPTPRPSSRIPSGFVQEGDRIDSASRLPMAIRHERTGYILRLVPAGDFYLGSPEGEGFDDERPRRRIHLDAYWIGETPVTCAQFVHFLNERGNQTEGGVTWAHIGRWVKIEQTGNTFRPRSGMGDHPVVAVSWYGARAFARWMGGDLPTEAQWEKAARGGRDVRWPWGDTWNSRRANTAERIAGVAEFKTREEWLKWWEPYQRTVLQRSDGYDDTTTPVKSYSSNGYGLYDMAGNVWEWCLDWYVADAYRQLRDGQRNPPPPASGEPQNVTFWRGGERHTDRQPCRVVRGGSWYSRAADARCANRGWGRPTDGDAATGLRVVVSPRP